MITPVLPMAALTEGEVVGVRVANQNILLCLVEGQYYAVSATCSHAQQSLINGRLRAFEISCPLHGARFDVRTGACTKAPAQQPIQRFPVVLEAGKVCIDVK